MAGREIVGVYTALRDQALGFGSAEIKAPPVVEGGRVLGVVMDMGYETAVVSIVGLADAASMYISNGGGMIGLGDNPPVAAAARRFVAAAEAAAPGLPERDEDALPDDG